MFRFLVTCALDNSVYVRSIEAASEDDAYREVDECAHTYECWMMLNEERWKNLLEVVRSEETRRVRG